jgi:DNA-binding transcriptional LysR family regulator
MGPTPNITLEQWRAFLMVVDRGGYAQAAEALNKSQSSVTYAVQKLESLLAVRAFEIRGRKAFLTPMGELLYRRARVLLEEAVDLERAAKKVSAGWEAEIGVAVEVLFPTGLLFRCLERFAVISPRTRIEVFETVLGGAAEALLSQGAADLAITPSAPVGSSSEALGRMRFVAAAHPDHPLHHLNRPLTARDLRHHRHLVVRESDARRTSKTYTVDVEQRWTLTSMASSVQAARMGLGFAWYPEEKIREELAAGTLAPLPLREGSERFVEIYLILRDTDSAGPGTLQLADIIRDEVTRAWRSPPQMGRG